MLHAVGFGDGQDALFIYARSRSSKQGLGWLTPRAVFDELEFQGVRVSKCMLASLMELCNRIGVGWLARSRWDASGLWLDAC